MQAIILAGGKGRRLLPYTTVLPKPLMPIGDYPIIEVILRQLKRAGFNRISISTGYLHELIHAYLDSNKTLGLKIDYSHEETPLGFPGYFLYIPTAIIGFTTTPADSCYMFSTRQRICYVQFGMSEGASGSNSVNTSFTLPIQCANNGHLPVQSHCAVFDNGGWILSTGHIYFEPNATVAIVCKAAVTGGDWTASGNKTAVGQFSYPI